MNNVEIRREWAMPSRWTFDIDPLREIVERELDSGLWVDPFAGKSNLADITNDIDPENTTDYSLRATEFLQRFNSGEVDGGVIFDPPYSATQLKRLYTDIDIEVKQNDTNGGFYGRNKDEIQRVCSPGATVVSFGWNSTGMANSRDFKKREILMVCHGSSRNDTICVVEDYKPEIEDTEKGWF